MFGTRYSCQILTKLDPPPADFGKNPDMVNLTKIRQLAAEFCHTDRQTMLTVAFRSFRESAKIALYYSFGDTLS
jgi:hypothetical protein